MELRTKLRLYCIECLNTLAQVARAPAASGGRYCSSGLGEGNIIASEQIVLHNTAVAHGDREGHGLMRYADGSTYEGEWANDKWHGHGTWVLCGADGHAQERYVGEMFEGKMHGRGAYSYSDGSTYDGQARL